MSQPSSTASDGRPRVRRRRVRSVHIRLVLCLGLFAFPAGVGTMAYYTDTATIETGPIESGTLDLTVGTTADNSTNLAGQGGQYRYSELTIADLTPGESIARPFAVRNAGTVPFAYNATITTTNNDLVASGSGLRVQIHPDSTPTETGSEEMFNRSGTCSGTAVSNQAVSTTSTADIHPTDQVLEPGEVRVYCARILLHTDSPNALQAQLTTLQIGLSAVQVQAP
ncbi:CalY family protein [Ruania suaedae]|uniref:SipW-dependent-type signal peptide-containing protein n=1 Tax=Ruania suaedae TaxID=2897774 RepID=UPI001E2DD61B|nr:SipW-dependent-type signal peptide-containing protein [Ruania suaedae]UFU01712.1 CalY family protein [Ruania suaedae]